MLDGANRATRHRSGSDVANRATRHRSCWPEHHDVAVLQIDFNASLEPDGLRRHALQLQASPACFKMVLEHVSKHFSTKWCLQASPLASKWFPQMLRAFSLFVEHGCLKGF
jgi:hypothetical protein